MTAWRYLTPSSVHYVAGRGALSLCDPAVTPARDQLFAVPPAPYDMGPWPGCGVGRVFYFPR